MIGKENSPGRIILADGTGTNLLKEPAEFTSTRPKRKTPGEREGKARLAPKKKGEGKIEKDRAGRTVDRWKVKGIDEYLSESLVQESKGRCWPKAVKGTPRLIQALKINENPRITRNALEKRARGGTAP